jgi:putative transposase
LRGQLHQICLDHRCYGSRRVTAELRAQGRLVNRKRVIRLMRVDNLLCLRKWRFVCTTDSRHTNLTTDWKPDGINQFWVADITYIRLSESFLYLAVISGCLFPAFFWLEVFGEVFGTDGSIPDHK